MIRPPRYSHLSHRHGRTALPAVHNEAPGRERPIGRTRQRTRAGETGRGCSREGSASRGGGAKLDNGTIHPDMNARAVMLRCQ